MGWRDKMSRRKSVEGATADFEFDYFSEEQGARFRGLVRRAFAELGIEATVYSGHVESADGVQYGLHNVAAACHNSADQDWDRLIRHHVETIVRAMSEGDSFEGLTDEEVLRRTYVRVSGRSTLPADAALSYGRVIADDLLELFALDCPETVALFNTDHVRRLGADALRTAGLANLIAEPIDEFERVGSDDGGWFGVVLGNSVHTASKLLVLDDVLRRTIGDADAPHGVLVCVPNRHQLAFHVIRDASVVPSLQMMARFAAMGFSDGVGAISPYVFWRRAGELTQLSFGDDDGRLQIRVGPEFGAVLEAVTVGD